MKNQVAYIGALLALNALVTNAKHTHEVLGALERRHRHHAREARASPAEAGLIQEEPKLRKRGQCEFPTDAGLVAVTPHMENAGWAMSPDQPCKPGDYCPIACPPGQMMAQWDPSATSYPSMVSRVARRPGCAYSNRTAVSTAITMATSTNHSRTALTA